MEHAMYRIYADNIPIFNGDEHILPSFIRACEELIITFQNVAEPRNPINKCIISTVISKLRGHAANIICPRNELNTWTLIKQTLKNTFDDGRNIDCLTNDLISITPNRNETLTQFGLKLQTLRSLLISKLNELHKPNEAKLIKIQYFEQMTLKTYINNLPEKIQIIVKCRDPKNIEEAINIVKSEEADNEFKQRTQNRFPKPNIPTNKPTPRPMFYKQPTPMPNSFTQNNQSPFGQTRTLPYQNFQQQPYQNFQQQPYMQFRPPFQANNSFRMNPQNSFQKPFTPYKNFQSNFPRQNTNVFKQNSNIAKNLPKPTPMEICSGNTSLPRNKNFRAKELYTQTVENTEDYTANPQETEQEQFYEYNNDFEQSEEQNHSYYAPMNSDYSQFYAPYPNEMPNENFYYEAQQTNENIPEFDVNFPKVPNEDTNT